MTDETTRTTRGTRTLCTKEKVTCFFDAWIHLNSRYLPGLQFSRPPHKDRDRERERGVIEYASYRGTTCFF